MIIRARFWLRSSGRKQPRFAIGDGAIVVSHGQGDGWAYVHWPQQGEYANSTNLVLASKLPEVMHFEVVNRRINEVAVFSDGIENLVLHFTMKIPHAL